MADQGNYKIRKISAGTVSTFAGTGSAGSTDGPVASAKLNYPTGLAIDAAGNLFVGDNGSTVRKISAGTVSTIQAGANVYAQATAVDAAGNIYVADPYGNRIIKITAKGIVSILAGSGSAGSANGTGVAASFSHPAGVAVDAIGNVYVADANNNEIRKITADGVVSTFAGSTSAGQMDGIGSAALFTSPWGIATDAAGNVYVSENLNGWGSIRKITPAGVVQTISSNWQYPQAVAVDKAFNVYWALASGQAGNQIVSLTQQGYSISPALPAGLSFDSTTGKISGTPTRSSSATNYTISAINAGGTSSTTVSIAVLGLINAGTASGSMSTCVGSASVSPKIQQFTVSGSFLTDNILVTAPANFEVSLASGSGFGSTVTLNQSGGIVNNTTIYVRLAATATVGSKSGNVVLSSNGAASQNVAVSGTVYAYPYLGPIQGTLSVCVGKTTALTANVTQSIHGTDSIRAAGPNSLSAPNNITATVTDQSAGAVPLYFAAAVWSSDNPAVATVNANTGLVTAVSSGTATISCSLTSNCTTTKTAVVTVNALPVVPDISGNTTVLVGSTATLADTFTGGVWSSDKTAVATIDGASGVVSGITAGTATITYTYTNSNGCTSSATKGITVVAIAPITGTTAVCAGSTTALADATAGGSWSSSDITIATIDVNGVVTGVAAGTVNISYTIAGSGAVTAAVTVNALPTGNITAANGSIICGTGGSVVLTASGGDSYAWVKGSTPITTTTGSQLTVTTTGVYTATVTNTTTGCSAAASNKITVTQLFAPKAGFSSAGYCVNQPVVFTNQSVVATSGPVTYVWSDNNAHSSTGANASFTYASIASYSVKLKVIPTACPAIADSSIKVLTIEAPQSGIRYGLIDAIQNDPTTKLQARGFGASYVWTPATGIADPTQSSTTITVQKEQDYKVQITAASGCVTVDSILVRVFDNSVYVPTVFSANGDGQNDKLYVSVVGVTLLKSYRIYNRWGKLVFETNNIGTGWDGKVNGVLQPLDTYVWVVEATDKFGNIISKQGNVTLLR